MKTDRQRRRGNVFVVMTSMGSMLGFGALAVDVGMIRVARTELQASIDAATLSATNELDGTVDGIARARSRAAQIALLNQVSGGPVDVTAPEVKLGWFNAYGTFVPWMPGADPGRVDTLGVRHKPHSLGVGLGGVAFGVTRYNVTAPSSARRPMDGASARTAPCWLPIAVPECWVNNLPPKTNPKPIEFRFSPTPNDKIAWADPHDNPSSSRLRDQLLAQCDYGPIHVGEPLLVNEGLHTSALQAVRDVINGESTAPADIWNTEAYGAMPPRDGTTYTANLPSKSGVMASRWGRTLEGVIPLVDAPDCSKLSFTKPMTIDRFAWGVIYDASVTGQDKNIYVQVDVVLPHLIWGDPDPAIKSNVVTRGTAALTEVEL